MAYSLRFSSTRLTFISAIALISVHIFTSTCSINSLVQVSSHNSLYGEESMSEPKGPVNNSSESVLLKEDILPTTTGTRETEATDTKDDDKIDKVCVIHVGPHKTGSSSLQMFLFRKYRYVLKKDNYVVPSFPHVGEGYEKFLDTEERFNQKNHVVFAGCLRFESAKKVKVCPSETIRSANQEYFRSFVNDAAKNNSNILLSSEAFDRDNMNITELTSYLVPQYKVHVVVYYRRFYDYIISTYNQVSRDGDNFGTSQYLTFVQWLTNNELELRQRRYSVAVYNRYLKAPGVFKVSVVNMHEELDNFDIITKFACDHLDQAPRLCNKAKSMTAALQQNPSHSLSWKLFRNSVKVYHSIKLSDSDKRWEQIEAKFNEMTDIPQHCLSPEMKNKLLQISLDSEIALTPESWHNSEEGLENLKSDFEEKSNSKLCSIDNEKILISPEWQIFLTGLEKDQIVAGS